MKKKISLLLSIILLIVLQAYNIHSADQTIASTEEMVGRGHATKADTINRWGLIEHDDDGVHEFVDGEGFLDTSDNEIMLFNVTGTPVNYLEVGTSDAGDPCTFKTLGDDAGIDLQIMTKGAGQVLAPMPGYTAHDTGIVTYYNATGVYIPGNMIECNGTICFWDSQLTFLCQSSGSNGSSDDFDASEWAYIAIDHSEVTDGTALVASKFINYDKDTGTPTWSEDKKGWYMSNAASDRVIGCILLDGTPEILEFYWDKNSDMYEFETMKANEYNGNPADTDWHDVTLTGVPNFGVMTAYLHILTQDLGANDQSVYIRTNGSSDTGLNYVFRSQASFFVKIYTDSSQVIEHKAGHADVDALSIGTIGFDLHL